MILSNIQIEERELAAEKFMPHIRPPVEVRDKLDIAYRIDGQSVIIFEIRPRWDKPDEKMEMDLAKTTFIKTKKLWKIYWMRGNLSWDHYKPVPFVKNISDFFDLIEKDELNCFFC